MQAEITQAIIQKIPLLTEEQQQKILEIIEDFLSSEDREAVWLKLKKAVADNRINLGENNLTK